MLSTISTLSTVKPPLRGHQFINHPQLAVSNQSPNSQNNCGNELSMKPLLSAWARGLLLAIPAPITSISGQQALDNQLVSLHFENIMK